MLKRMLIAALMAVVLAALAVTIMLGAVRIVAMSDAPRAERFAKTLAAVTRFFNKER